MALGQPFRLLARLCPAEGAGAPAPRVTRFTVDATMPEHRHGMNYAARLTETDGGLIADGLLFHMAGRWQLRIEAVIGPDTERFTDDIVLR